MAKSHWNWDGSKPWPANGIVAETQNGKFGKTWWASRWITALEWIVDPARLSRGRTYARTGQVLKLEIERSEILAMVQGSRRTPYKVKIKFSPLSDEEWEKVIDAISTEAIYAAKLLSGEMPGDIEAAFNSCGASLFPARDNDLETSCTCPDWANPCKHVAAVHYLLGERFDADPFLIFALRGRSKESIIEALRQKRAGALLPESEPKPGPSPSDENEAVPPLAETLNSFWSVPEEILSMQMNFTAAPIDGLPVKRLGPPAFWTSQTDFTKVMTRAYQKIAAHALRLAMGDG